METLKKQLIEIGKSVLSKFNADVQKFENSLVEWYSFFLSDKYE
jgi:hypothetical protein